MPENTGGTTNSKAPSNGWSSVTVPELSLPKGGGAIRGIGEKFAANPVTGSGSFTVPIYTSPGRSGFGPKLALSYDSGAGNGPFGFGWNLDLPAITRKTEKGLPQYADEKESDVFILSGVEDLVPELAESTSEWQRVTQVRTVAGVAYEVQRYRPRIEGLFARIERWTNPADPADSFWRSISRDNITTWYGKTSNSRIADPADPKHIFRWLICETHDDKGNVLVQEYKAETSDGVSQSFAHERNRTDSTRSANRYLKRINYGNRKPYFPTLKANEPWPTQPTEWLFELVFDYGEHNIEIPAPEESTTWPARVDPFSSYRGGFEVRTYRLCQRVLMFHRFEELGATPCLVRSTDFSYSSDTNQSFSFVSTATQSGYKRLADGSYIKKSMPPLEFEYSQPISDEEIHEVDSESLENLPSGIDGNHYRLVDLDGEGAAGILTDQGSAWFYKRNLSLAPGGQPPTARFGPAELVAEKPSLAAVAGGRSQLMDLSGGGQLDVVDFAGATPGFYQRTQDEKWVLFTPFELLPVLDWTDPNLRFIDLTGDGHADVLISEDEVFCWHQSLAEAGFGPSEKLAKTLDEEHGPNLVFADQTQVIYAADMSGDGLSDLVRVRNGEICYWPNLGYGRFGAKVTMDSAPWFENPDLFDQRRILLADVDGTGTTDVIYLTPDGVRIYFNQSGNNWSAPQTISSVQFEDLSSFQVVDLLGSGTACLVWSSPLPANERRAMCYLDLMGGQKPHLLTKLVNNLGAETIVHYSTSTKFFLADKLAGKPWITRLPFPVHVVERAETYDRISGNRFVTRFAYHHGHFDGFEREFRGFGMVEQWDTEEFAALNSNPEFAATNVDEPSHVPPVLTRTWFHTGLYLESRSVSNYFAGLADNEDTGEYYREPKLTDEQAKPLLLGDSVIPSGLSLAEEREACRALKGQMLRQEVYAEDGTELQVHPYTVIEQNFTVQLVQPSEDQRHAIFFSHPREALTYQYERNPEDPRIAHVLTMEVDAFGNVLKSAVIGYGRRNPDQTLTSEDQSKQSRILITYNENYFTNGILQTDSYRSPLPFEARTYELTGLPAPQDSSFTFETVLEAGINAASLTYEQAPENDQLQKRLIEHVRSKYRPNDLGDAEGTSLALLPLGVVESQALPGESYKLALTEGLVTTVFAGKVSDAMLETEGRYVHSEGDANWWIPSGRSFFSPGTNDAPAKEMAFARDHFFLAHRFRDPFHTDEFNTESFLTYDHYDFLTLETRDALGNRISAGERDATGNLKSKALDYRVLQPVAMTDPNGNRAFVALDVLGMIAGTAVAGKAGENLGDSLVDFNADLDDATILTTLESPFVDPALILGSATTRLIYDQFAYYRTKTTEHPQPVVIYALARETHAANLAPGEQTAIQHSFSYTDGFGREIQKKVQAEAGPLVAGGPQISPRWVGNGWTVFNNKGKPVRQFEPFFSDTHRFEFDVRRGVSPILCYDPAQRVVATINPNHTWQKVVFDSWHQETWDLNDTALITDPQNDIHVGDYFRRLSDSEYLPTWHELRASGGMGAEEKAAAIKAALHESTPQIAFTDSVGRTFLTVAPNRFYQNGVPTEESYASRTELDIEGNQRAVIDALDRVVMRYDYDMLSTSLYSSSMEAGDRWILNNIAGKPIYAWDSHGHRLRTTYDQLGRPSETYLSVGNPNEIVVGRSIFGEEQAGGESANLRAKLFQSFDGAGVVTNEAFDFKGNLIKSSRQLTAEYKATLDWSATVTVEPEVFTTQTTFDALNRPVEMIAPDNSTIRPSYNEANLLERVEANLRGSTTSTSFVNNIGYNAKGQRERIDYGNGVFTTYEYDTDTFRLMHLQTMRGSEALQNLTYTYDPIGNITHIHDDAQQTIYFRNQRVEPSNDYTYDALYRLSQARGREHLGQIGNQNNPPTASDAFNEFHTGLTQPGDGNAMGTYLESYVYDAVGNILSMQHRGSNPSHPGWTRAYSYNEVSLLEPSKTSNRLSLTQIGDGPLERYTYDEHGSMTTMPHLSLMRWNYRDQLEASAQQVVNTGTPETTYYVYDSAGQRVRKVTERQTGAEEIPTRMNERIYLGVFEIYREFNGGGHVISLEREGLHVMDREQRIALMETRTQGNDGSPESLIRFQLANHLGSVSLEMDEAGRVASYEEYLPYGSSSYQAVDSGVTTVAKRYRYTGKERDEHTGFSYHGARYYAPWLGRWTACDQRETEPTYSYAHNNPVILLDANGRWANLAPALIGAGVGAVIGAGVSAGLQYYKTGKIDLADVGAHAVGGAVAGGIAGATLGVSLLVEGGTLATVGEIGIGGGMGSVAGASTTRAIMGEETTKEDVALDFAVGVATAGLIKGGGKILSTYLQGGDTATVARETLSDVMEQTDQAYEQASRGVAVELGAGDAEASVDLALQGYRVIATDPGRAITPETEQILQFFGGEFQQLTATEAAEQMPNSADLVVWNFMYPITTRAGNEGAGNIIQYGTYAAVEDALAIARSGATIRFVTEDLSEDTVGMFSRQATELGATNIRTGVAPAFEIAPGATMQGIPNAAPEMPVQFIEIVRPTR